MGIRAMLVYPLVFAVVALGRSPEWLWILLAASLLAGIANIASLTFKIRREERATER
jgi:hypothetical protein